MRGRLGATVVLAALGLAGCGSDDKPTTHVARTTSTTSTTPAKSPPGRVMVADRPHSPIGQRYLNSNDFPGYPGADTPIYTNARKFLHRDVRNPGKAVAQLRRLGFVAGVEGSLVDARDHAAGAVVIEQFRKPAGAFGMLGIAYAHVRSAASSAAVRFVLFGIPGVPTAKGWEYAATGRTARRVIFADGRFFYVLATDPSTGGPSRRAVVGAVQSWYRRVHALR
jgi:hypothetical protein